MFFSVKHNDDSCQGSEGKQVNGITLLYFFVLFSSLRNGAQIIELVVFLVPNAIF